MRRKPLAAQPAAVAFNPVSKHRTDAELEAWICERLKLRDLFAGVTDTATRAARLKVVLIQRGLTESIAGDGRPITWRKLFADLYHEELTT